MNDRRELKALSLLSGIDESFIDEAQSAEKINLVRKAKKFPVMLAAVITALVMSAVGVTAAVQGYISHRKNVEHEYKNKAFVDEIEKRQGQPITAENKHLRLTVDSIISDKMYIQATATLEGLDEQGKAYISKHLYLTKADFERLKDSAHSYLPHMVTDIGGADQAVRFDQGADLSYGQRGEHTEGSFTFGVAKARLMGAQTVHVRCLDWSSIGIRQGLDDLKEGIFEGIEFDLPVQTNFDTLTLAADTRYFYVSEVGFYNDLGGWHDDENVVIHYSDGSEETVDLDHSNSFGEKLFELERIQSVEYMGTTYIAKKIEKAESPTATQHPEA